MSGKGRLRAAVRGTLLNGALVLGSLAFAVLLAELAIRLFAPQQLIQIRPDLWQPMDTIGWAHRPGVSTTINTGERTVSVMTDSAGFRVGAETPREADIEVLLLGDSFVEALQVEYEQSFAGLLEDRLTEATGRTVAVRNAGIDDWGPSQYFLRARSVLPHGDYGLVVTTIFVGNDIQPERLDYLPPRQATVRHHFHIPEDASWSAVADATIRPLNDALETRSHLWIFIRSRLETLSMRLGLSALHFPREFLKSSQDGPGWDVVGDIASDIQQLATGHGAEALFLLVPTSFQVNEETFRQYVLGYDIDSTAVDLELPNRRMAEELRSRGLAVIDALPAFRAAHDRGLSLYGTVDPHLSPAGHRVLTELVSPVAARMLGGTGSVTADGSTSP